MSITCYSHNLNCHYSLKVNSIQTKHKLHEGKTPFALVSTVTSLATWRGTLWGQLLSEGQTFSWTLGLYTWLTFLCNLFFFVFIIVFLCLFICLLVYLCVLLCVCDWLCLCFYLGLCVSFLIYVQFPYSLPKFTSLHFVMNILAGYLYLVKSDSNIYHWLSITTAVPNPSFNCDATLPVGDSSQLLQKKLKKVINFDGKKLL